MRAHSGNAEVQVAALERQKLTSSFRPASFVLWPCGFSGGCASRQLINEYRADLDRLRAVSGSRRESVLREAFKDLLKRWGRKHDLLFVPEHAITTPRKNRIYLDGALLHALRVPFGYWEASDALLSIANQ